VLLNPTAKGANLLLWVAGPAALLVGLTGAGFYLRRRRSAAETVVQPLSADEAKRLSEILKS
jgi:cytochrome c-type biogenesis protein CcmH